MTKAPSNLQELRRRIYRKAKSETTQRFWGLFVHITKSETLEEAYRIAKGNDGAPGIDGQSFRDIASGDTLKPAISGHLKPRHFSSYPMRPNLPRAWPAGSGAFALGRSGPKALNSRGFGTESPLVPSAALPPHIKWCRSA